MKNQARVWRGLWRRQVWAFGGLWGHLEALGAQKADGNDGNAAARRNARGPWSQTRTRQSSTDSFSHALLPHRGAADPPRDPAHSAGPTASDW